MTLPPDLPDKDALIAALLALLGVLAGAEAFVDIARFGDRKLEFLRRFRPFEAGTPSHDHLGAIFASLDAEKFQRCFWGWVTSLTGTCAEVIAVYGKTSRGSHQKSGGKAAIHKVSVFAARERLVLGQVKVDGKSNEITIIPRLFGIMNVGGAPNMRLQTSQQSNTWRTTCSEKLPARTHCGSGVKSPLGTMTSWLRSYQAERFTRFPWFTVPIALTAHAPTFNLTLADAR